MSKYRKQKRNLRRKKRLISNEHINVVRKRMKKWFILKNAFAFT